MNIDLHETQNIIDSTKEQIYLQGKTHIGNRAKPRRRQVFNCLLGVGVGSEFQKRRPCVVLSNTINNINAPIIVIVPITHTQKSYPVFVPINDKYDQNGNLVLSGYADVSNIRAVSSYRLAGLVCELDNSEMKLIDAAVACHLDIMKHYNTIIKTLDDKEKHVKKLSDILDNLQGVVGANNYTELIEYVENMISERNDNQ